ncbi:MAG: hypothetical protein KAX20_01955 [Candidatus Omnitrophica bacterium]|nr:hypothetical protein [Candidatus Omnitrophota bacterium]
MQQEDQNFRSTHHIVLSVVMLRATLLLDEALSLSKKLLIDAPYESEFANHCFPSAGETMARETQASSGEVAQFWLGVAEGVTYVPVTYGNLINSPLESIIKTKALRFLKMRKLRLYLETSIFNRPKEKFRGQISCWVIKR